MKHSVRKNRFGQNQNYVTYLLEVAELAEGFGLDGVGKLGYLAQITINTLFGKVLSIQSTNTDK